MAKKLVIGLLATAMLLIGVNVFAATPQKLTNVEYIGEPPGEGLGWTVTFGENCAAPWHSIWYGYQCKGLMQANKYEMVAPIDIYSIQGWFYNHPGVPFLPGVEVIFHVWDEGAGVPGTSVYASDTIVVPGDAGWQVMTDQNGTLTHLAAGTYYFGYEFTGEDTAVTQTTADTGCWAAPHGVSFVYYPGDMWYNLTDFGFPSDNFQWDIYVTGEYTECVDELKADNVNVGEGATYAKVPVYIQSCDIDTVGDLNGVTYCCQWDNTFLTMDSVTQGPDLTPAPQGWMPAIYADHFTLGITGVYVGSGIYPAGIYHLFDMHFTLSDTTPLGCYGIDIADGIEGLTNTFTYQMPVVDVYPLKLDGEICVIPYTLTIAFTPPPPQTMDEGASLTVTVDGTSSDPLDPLTLSADGSLPGFATWTDANGTGTVSADIELDPGYCDAGNYTITFTLTGGSGSINVPFGLTVNNVNRDPTVSCDPDSQDVPVSGSTVATINVVAADDDIACSDDAIGVGYTVDPTPVGAVNFDGSTLTFDPDDTDGDKLFTFEFKVTDQYGGEDSCECVVYTTTSPYATVDLALDFKKMVVEVGQQNVCVPVFLTNNDPYYIGGWDVVISWDPTAVTVVKAVTVDECDPPDSVHVCFPGEEDLPWLKYGDVVEIPCGPEYFHYTLGANGHANWIRVVGIMNMDWPQEIVPDIPPGEQQILFYLVVCITPYDGWAGHEVFFNFETKGCNDNTLTDSEGSILWGPDAQSVDYSTGICDERQNWKKKIMLIDGRRGGCAAIGIESRIPDFVRGDVNCDNIPYSVADVQLFINYLVHGQAYVDALIPDYVCTFDDMSYASDVDEDGYPWTINDLVVFLQHLNAGAKVAADRIAGAYYIINHEGTIPAPVLTDAAKDMNLAYSDVNGVMKVVVYSLEGKSASANAELISVPGYNLNITSREEYANAFKATASVLPSEFALVQNYPNPFNPTTNIAFDLPENAYVTLTVYNIAGEKVAELVNGDVKAGQHTVSWNAADVSSGVYFYRITAGNFTATRKMILMK